MTTHLLEMRSVGRVHGDGPTKVQALHDISLTVSAGELVAVMGPSGSGKSTLLNLAGGLDQATSGDVLVQGQSLRSLTTNDLATVRRRTCGFIFQDFNLVPSLSVLENVALPLELDGIAIRKARAEAQSALEMVNVGQTAQRFPDQISGGQQQRVSIARALVGQRNLILADEPTGALDSSTGEEILAVLRERCDDGAGCLLVTHEARYTGWADRVIYLRDGLVIDKTTPTPKAPSAL